MRPKDSEKDESGDGEVLATRHDTTISGTAV
jgi:hypothetical protein